MTRKTTEKPAVDTAAGKPAADPADRPGMDVGVRELATMGIETLRAFAASAGVETTGDRRLILLRLAEAGFFECPACRSSKQRLPGRCLYPTRNSAMLSRLKLRLRCPHCGLGLRFWLDP